MSHAPLIDEVIFDDLVTIDSDVDAAGVRFDPDKHYTAPCRVCDRWIEKSGKAGKPPAVHARCRSIYSAHLFTRHDSPHYYPKVRCARCGGRVERRRDERGHLKLGHPYRLCNHCESL